MRKDRKVVSKEKKHAENLIGQLTNSLNQLLDMAVEDTSTGFYVRAKLQDIGIAVMNELINGRRNE